MNELDTDGRILLTHLLAKLPDIELVGPKPTSAIKTHMPR
jgi:hypothetical protein